MTESTYDLAPEPDNTPAPSPAPAATPEPVPEPEGPTPMTLAGKLLAVLLVLGLLAGAGAGYYLFKMLKPTFAAEATLHFPATDTDLAAHVEAIIAHPHTKVLLAHPDSEVLEPDLMDLGFVPDADANAIHIHTLSDVSDIAQGHATAAADFYITATHIIFLNGVSDEITAVGEQQELNIARRDELSEALKAIGDRAVLEAHRADYAEQIGSLPAELKILTEGLNIAAAEEARLQAIIESDTIDGFPTEAFAELANDYEYAQLKSQSESYASMIEQLKADNPNHPAIAQYQSQVDSFMAQRRTYEVTAMEAFMPTIRERASMALDELQQLQYAARATATRLEQVDAKLVDFDQTQELWDATLVQSDTFLDALIALGVQLETPAAVTRTPADSTETIWPDYRQPAMIACAAGGGVSLIGLLALVLAARRRKTRIA